jgi:hypothetical protein
MVLQTKTGLRTPSLKHTTISLLTLHLYKPGFLANRYQVLKCSFVPPDTTTRNILWYSTDIGSIWTMSNSTTSSIWSDQAAIKPNSMPYTQMYASKYHAFIKIHSRKMKHARMPSEPYGITKAPPLADSMEP